MFLNEKNILDGWCRSDVHNYSCDLQTIDFIVLCLKGQLYQSSIGIILPISYCIHRDSKCTNLV